MSIVKIRAALENALQAMPNIIPAVDIDNSITSGGRSVFTTVGSHGLVNTLGVTVRDHSSLNDGAFNVLVLDSTRFVLLDSVSNNAISVANGTGGNVSANLIAWENWSFKAPPGIPYAKTTLLPARPDNNTLGSGHYREIGICQITLMYPIQRGPGAAAARAELIRSTFPRGASFDFDGIKVQIDKTPEITTSTIEEECYRVSVRIFYWADIFN